MHVPRVISFLGIVLLAASLLSGAASLRAQDSDAVRDTMASVPLADSVPVLQMPDTAAAHRRDTAVAHLRLDSSAMIVRTPGADAMKRFTDDDAFAYDREQRDPESLWDRIINWIAGKLLRLLGVKGSSKVLDAIGKLLAAAVLVYVVMKLTKTDLRGVFSRKPKAAAISGFMEADEDIHEMDFDALVEAAVAGGNYRRAVRLLYLKQMKAMIDRNLIRWRLDRTNDDYQRELAGSPLERGFREIRRVFEYVWYGDMPVDASRYLAVRELFSQFGESIAEVR